MHLCQCWLLGMPQTRTCEHCLAYFLVSIVLFHSPLLTLNSPLGVPKKVPILGINHQRMKNSPLIGISSFYLADSHGWGLRHHSFNDVLARWEANRNRSAIRASMYTFWKQAIRAVHHLYGTSEITFLAFSEKANSTSQAFCEAKKIGLFPVPQRPIFPNLGK